ncbi:MAG: uncharacterized protein PWQ57_432 [Desulfovibrionales bacterium]|jgi:uncharacterized protein YprB with RNaseH-like and TPR domain|nr:uncharacterized protein [Desulfovibrionales bacterium]
MLQNTFLHLAGVGETTEQRFWKAGFTTWSDVLDAPKLPFWRSKEKRIKTELEESFRRLEMRDAGWFCSRLPAGQSWRYFPEFRDLCASVDIETTGGMFDEEHITSIAMCAGGRVTTYVYGRNLEEFLDRASEYAVFITFNGRCFDLPYLQRSFGSNFPHGHIDLRFIFKPLGFTGGLKVLEKNFGLDREELDGVDGLAAVWLWREYEVSGDPLALETLLAYNAMDTANLETLMVEAYNARRAEIPLPGFEPLERPAPVEIPHTPHIPTLARVLQQTSCFSNRRSHGSPFGAWRPTSSQR